MSQTEDVLHVEIGHGGDASNQAASVVTTSSTSQLIYKVEYPSTGDDEVPQLTPLETGDLPGNVKSTVACSKCCCLPHCLVNNHTQVWKKAVELGNSMQECTIVDIEDIDEVNVDEESKFKSDGITSMLLDVHFNLEVDL